MSKRLASALTGASLRSQILSALRGAIHTKSSKPFGAPSMAVREVNPAIQREISDIFKQNKVEFNPEQLQQVVLMIQGEMNQQKFPEIPENLKPIFSKEELTALIRQRVATMTVAGDEGKENITVFGYGNMAKAVAEGLDAKVTAVVYDASKEREQKAGVDYIAKTSPVYEDIFQKESGDVIISVKPQKLGDIAEDLMRLKLKDSSMIISVLAGISTKILKSICPKGAAIIRTMPNTPMAVGCGVTGVFLPPELSHKKSDILKYFGAKNNQVVFVDREEKINEITGLSGSGPAYFFLIAEMVAKENPKITEKEVFDIMRKACSAVDIATYEPKHFTGSMSEMIKDACGRDGGVEDFILSFTKGLYQKALAYGFSVEDAKTLAQGTAMGSGEYGFQSEKNAETLRVNVTSPGGTTAEALRVFNESRASSLGELIGSAVQAAVDKAGVLGEAAEKKFLPQAPLAVEPVASSQFAPNSAFISK